MQVAEHAAILADDAAKGIERNDISLKRLARAGAAHSAPCLFIIPDDVSQLPVGPLAMLGRLLP